jgi:hypothetical protein
LDGGCKNTHASCILHPSLLLYYLSTLHFYQPTKGKTTKHTTPPQREKYNYSSLLLQQNVFGPTPIEFHIVLKSTSLISIAFSTKQSMELHSNNLTNIDLFGPPKDKNGSVSSIGDCRFNHDDFSNFQLFSAPKKGVRIRHNFSLTNPHIRYSKSICNQINL